MIYDVKAYFGLDKEFRNAGYFETEHYKHILLDVKENSSSLIKSFINR